MCARLLAKAHAQVMIPSGMRKAAACTDMPVMAAMVAAPPSKSIAVTRTLVRRQKPRKTLCAEGPHLLFVGGCVE